MSDVKCEFPFGEEFQRKILILAIRGNLVAESNGAFQAQFFGAADAATDAKTPRQLLAEIVEKFTKASTERPGEATMSELVRERASTLRPEARTQLEQEWSAVRQTVVPDPEYVKERVCRWAREVGTLAALIRSGKALQDSLRTGAGLDINLVVAEVTKAATVGFGGSKRGGWWLDQSDLSYWKNVHDLKTRVGSRLAPLDAALRGGPKFGELFFAIAPPKASKTALMCNFAVGASQLGKGVAFFSYEMGFDEMLIRLDRRLLKSTRKDISENLARLTKAKQSMKLSSAGEIWLEQCNPVKFGCKEIHHRVEQLRGEGVEIDMVIIDYLNLMAGRVSGTREWRHDLISISREMKDLAVDLDVVVWSATLCNRQAVNKVKISKQDIAEAFEVIAVCDGAIGICADETMIAAKLKNLYLTALRDAEDEKFAGTYRVDLDRMLYSEVDFKQAFLPKEPESGTYMEVGE